jgi:hypothetical protein
MLLSTIALPDSRSNLGARVFPMFIAFTGAISYAAPERNHVYGVHAFFHVDFVAVLYRIVRHGVGLGTSRPVVR